MTSSALNTGKQYQFQVSLVVNLLIEGISYFYIFVKDLEAGVVGSQNTIEYIKTKLCPSTENLKAKFGSMIEEAKKLLDEVNRNFESCELDIKRVNDEIKDIDYYLLQLQNLLKGKELDVREAERQCSGKQQGLSKAESVLCDARKKFKDAETTQQETLISGFVAIGVSIPLAILFPPLALLGIIGGIAADVAGVTVLEEVKIECSNRVSTAGNAVSTSEKDLEKAKNLKKELEQYLSQLTDKKFDTEKELQDKRRMLDDIQKDRQDCILMNEYIQKLYKELCDFSGKCNVLCCETHGGYSLDCLKHPTLTVCSSLNSLLQCRVIQSSCDPYQQKVIKGQLQQIQAVPWPSVNYNEDSLI